MSTSWGGPMYTEPKRWYIGSIKHHLVTGSDGMTSTIRRTLLAVALSIGTASIGVGICQTAEAATCTIHGTSGNDHLYGTSGPDVICGGGGNDVIYGYGGADIIYAGSGNDTVYGGGGNDTVYAGYGDDEVLGGPGNDTLLGQAQTDTLEGDSGADTVSGGDGIDWCVINDGAEHYGTCNRWAYRLPAATPTLADVTEQWQRRYLSPDQSTWDHCLVSNCGNVTQTYCFVHPNGWVDSCLNWDGYADGWADTMFQDFLDECGDPRYCGGTGPYTVAGDLVVNQMNGTGTAIWAREGTWIIDHDFQVN